MTVTRQRTLIIYHIHANLYYIAHTHNTDKQNMLEVFKMKKKTAGSGIMHNGSF